MKITRNTIHQRTIKNIKVRSECARIVIHYYPMIFQLCDENEYLKKFLNDCGYTFIAQCGVRRLVCEKTFEDTWAAHDGYNSVNFVDTLHYFFSIVQDLNIKLIYPSKIDYNGPFTIEGILCNKCKSHINKEEIFFWVKDSIFCSKCAKNHVMFYE